MLVTVTEAAEIIGISRAGVDRAIRRGLLEVHSIVPDYCKTRLLNILEVERYKRDKRSPGRPFKSNC